MAAGWYLSLGGVEQGPLTSANLKELARTGEIAPDTALKKGADGAWVPAGRVKGLFEVSKPPPPPPPPAPPPIPREESENFVQPQVVATPESPPLQPTQTRQDVNRGFRLGLGLAIGCACGLLLVLGLGLMILVTIRSWAVKSYERIETSAYLNAASTQIKAFKTPLQAYRLDIGDFPSTSQGLEALLAAPSDLGNPDKWVGPYLDSQVVPKDPWDNVYQYEYPSNVQEKWPDIWSFGPDGQNGTDDDVGNWMFEE